MHARAACAPLDLARALAGGMSSSSAARDQKLSDERERAFEALRLENEKLRETLGYRLVGCELLECYQ